MTRLSNQKTFYAKEFESVLRNYFKCPSQTTIGKPVAYLFLQNKDNKTKYYRTKDKGLSDIMLKSYANGSLAEEKYLTFFPYQDHFNGSFTVGEEHWNNFIKATDFSGEKTIWGIFCISKDEFILAHNASTFNTNKITITTDHYIFDAVEVRPQDYVSFERLDKGDWLVTKKGNTTIMKYDKQYKAMLPNEAQCFPLPRIGKEHLIADNNGIYMATFTDIANKYHGNDSVDNFITKLRRNLATNNKQVQKDLRMKPLKGMKLMVIPDDFTQQDFIEWQNNHRLSSKREDMKEYMRNYRRKLNNKDI